MKKILGSILLIAFVTCMCSCKDNNTDSSSLQGEITVVSREEGSGTRDAFTELMEIVDEKGNDITYDGAEITNSTSVMLTTINGNKRAIGYVSMGSLSDDVKAVKIDGAAADVKSVKDGSYKISRPFNICYREGELSDLAKDFEAFVMSADGQKIIESESFISVDAEAAYKSSGKSGKISVAGSTSVAPVMEVLADEYKKLNPNVKVEIQQSGSSAGISSAIEGVCDIGMSSRDLNDTEKRKLVQRKIAIDGIAVVVNKENPIDDFSSGEIREIFTGEISDWSQINQVIK